MTYKQYHKTGALILAILMLVVSGCSKLPIRNPLEGRKEPKLSTLPELENQPQKMATLRWSKHVSAKQKYYSKFTPLVVGNTVYCADQTGKVVALSRSSGKTLWSKRLKRSLTMGPSMVNGKLFLASSDTKLIAMDKSNGKVLWETKMSSEVLAKPAGSGNKVLVHAIDGSVRALNDETGEELWVVDETTPSLTLRYNSSPVVVEDTVLTGFATGKLMALNVNTGLIEWERAIAMPRGRSELQRMVDISADPIVVGSDVYVITYQGKLAGVNIHSGNLLWERDISSYHKLAFRGNALFVTDNEHCLWALDRHTGTTLWKQNRLAKRYITGPVISSNTIAVADRGGVIHFVSINTGTLVGRHTVSGKVYQGLVSAQNEIFVKSHSGRLSVLEIEARST